MPLAIYSVHITLGSEICISLMLNQLQSTKIHVVVLNDSQFNK